MKFVVGPGSFVVGGTVHGPGTVIEGGPCPPIDAIALDADCSVLMWLTYRRLRRRLQRRLWPTEEALFRRIIHEIPEPALQVMWGLRPRPAAVKPKPASDYAMLGARLAAKGA
jgi:hypothetical protein